MAVNTGVWGENGDVTITRRAPTTGAGYVLAAAKGSRQQLTLNNVGAVDTWVGTDAALTTAAGSTKLGASQQIVISGIAAKKAWYGRTASSTADIAVIEETAG